MYIPRKSNLGEKSLGEVLPMRILSVMDFLFLFLPARNSFRRKSMESDFDSCEYLRNSSYVILAASKLISFSIHYINYIKSFYEVIRDYLLLSRHLKLIKIYPFKNEINKVGV